MSKPSFSGDSAEGQRHALRLTIKYKGSKFSLAERHRVEMICPPSDRTDEYEGQSGFWVEVRDANGRVLYRRVMHNPIRTHREAPSGDPGQSFTHVEVEKPKGVFTVLVPDVAEAAVVAVHASPAGDRRRAAKEIFKLDLESKRSSKKRGR